MEDKVNPLIQNVKTHFDKREIVKAGGGMLWLFAIERLPESFPFKNLLLVLVPPFMMSLSWLVTTVQTEFKRVRRERLLERTRLAAMLELERLLDSPELDSESKQKIRAMEADVRIARAVELTEKLKRLSRPE